jgi:hypothetical protein
LYASARRPSQYDWDDPMPVPRQASMLCSIWAIACGPGSRMATAQPLRIVPIATQCGKPRSVERAIASSASSCVATLSRRN